MDAARCLPEDKRSDSGKMRTPVLSVKRQSKETKQKSLDPLHFLQGFLYHIICMYVKVQGSMNDAEESANGIMLKFGCQLSHSMLPLGCGSTYDSRGEAQSSTSTVGMSHVSPLLLVIFCPISLSLPSSSSCLASKTSLDDPVMFQIRP